MLYEFLITVPANTPESAPVEQILPLDTGIIHRVEIGFPEGPRALVHIQLLYHEHQFSPSNPDGNHAWDGYTVSYDTRYPVDVEPFEIKIRAWSDADTYDYDIAVRIGVLRPDEINPPSALQSGLTKLLSLIGVKT